MLRRMYRHEADTPIATLHGWDTFLLVTTLSSLIRRISKTTPRLASAQ